MKTIAFALAALLVAPGTLLAKDLTTASADASRKIQSTRKVAQPELDRTLTGSIRRSMSFKKNHFAATADKGVDERRELSGIEVNPWIVPSFR